MRLRAAAIIAAFAASGPVAAAEPGAAGRLHLSAGSPELSDATLDSVAVRATGGTKTTEVRAYGTIDAPEETAATALFLARSFAAICKAPRVSVTMVRGDLGWSLIGRDVPARLTTAATAAVADGEKSDVRLVRRLPSKIEVESTVFYEERLGTYGAGSEARAVVEAIGRFRLKKGWRPSAGVQLTPAVAREVADIADTPTLSDAAQTIAGACRGYDGLGARR